MSNFKNVWYSSEIFFGGIFIGTFIAISSSNWTLAWMGMELNMLSFLGWMCSTSKVSTRFSTSWGLQDPISSFASNVEPFAKYFLAQSVGTALFLFSPLVWGVSHMVYYSSVFILFGMMMKSGVAPFHQWFPSVCANVSWVVNLMLMFWQKVAPLFIIVGASVSYGYSVLLISGLNLFFGGLGALGQTQFRPLFAYSSISHMGWMMAMMFFSGVGFFFYFLLYGLMIIPTIYVLQVLKVYSFKDVGGSSRGAYVVYALLIIMMLGVSGMPPFTGFFMKAYSVYLMMCMDYFGLALFFCGFTVISLSYYVNIMFISSLLGVLGGFSKSYSSSLNSSTFNSFSETTRLVNILLVVVLVSVSLPVVSAVVI